MVKSNKNRVLQLSAGSALRALALFGAGVSASAIIATPAMAQDYTAGAVNGTVTDENGAPVAGSTVTLSSSERGQTRTATTNSSGGFRFTGVQTGTYDVTVEANGQAAYRAEGLRILPGQTASLDILLSTSEDIVVTGERLQQIAAFEGTTTGLNVDVAELVKTTPIGRDLTSVVLLAPSSSRGDSTFGNLAAISGSSVAENAYYVNGLNTTNFDNYLGSARIPFEFYRTVEVKAGGYPAEYGRATGAIINGTTKSGTNEFKGAVHINWAPNFLQSDGKTLLNYESDGSFEAVNNPSAETSNSYSVIVEAGGPIIEDRLFVYGLLEMRSAESLTVNRQSGTGFSNKQNDPFWGVKVDAYPIDSQHLEFTIWDSSDVRTRSDLAYSEVNGAPVLGLAKSVTEFETGGLSYVGKYTGNFTDWFTLSAGYGVMKDNFANQGVAGDAGAIYNRNLSGATVSGVANSGFFTGQLTASTTSPWNTKREFYRVDADIFVNLLGEHHFRVGFDQEVNTLNKSTVRNGGAALLSEGLISEEAFNAGGGNAGLLYLLRPGGIVELNYFNSGGSFDATNRAFYIQDQWTITDRLTVNLGLRRDDFSVDRADGVELVNLDKNYAPRVGFTYDVGANNEGTFFGSYGTYYLPFASNTAFRMTGSEFFFRERWTYTGIDSNGAPILGSQATNIAAYQSACPFALTDASSGQNCSVTGDGSVADPSALIASNLKATKQTEWILGYKHRIGSWTFGINYTHRKLNANAEDVAIDAAVLAYCDAEGIAGCEDTWTGFHQYTIINPGSDVTVALDGLDGQTVTFTAAQLGYPKAKRTYDGVEFTFNRAWDGVWSVGGSYLWSKSKGNSEGFVSSDFGQADAGITQDFDQPGFNDGADGFLANHRQHRFKMFGAVAMSDWFTLGTNISVESPRKLSCLGWHPTDVFAQGYGAASHYCGGVLSPRGTAQKSDWRTTIDLSGRFNLNIGSQAVTFRVDVFNLLNTRSVTERGEFGDLDIESDDDGNITAYIPDPNYGVATGYQAPRSVRVGLDFEF